MQREVPIAGRNRLRHLLECPGRAGFCFAPVVSALLLHVATAYPQEIPASDYAERRRQVMDRLSDGILLLHARSGPAAENQWGFVQNASFQYFSGLVNLPGAVLALDGPRRRVTLFVPPEPLSFGQPVADLVPDRGATTARKLDIDDVASWDSLFPYLKSRVTSGTTRVYVDESRRPEALGAPDSLAPVAGETTLWKRSLSSAVGPSVPIESARIVIQALRWVKSPAEIEVLRANARLTAAALLEALRTIAPGMRQRVAEAAVVRACIVLGGQGPSFWPWIMSGPNALMRRLVRAPYDYEALDRVMRNGELARVDLGCASHGYGADVGRTVPVSGRFSPGQRETWDLLIAAYRAGLARMRADVTIEQVMAASRDELARRQPSLFTAQAKQAAAKLMGQDGMSLWSIHGVGIDSGESPLPTLADGAVIAFEPMFDVDGDGFYLEDMIRITATGHEVLSAGLPYSAAEIEAAMRPK